MTIRSLVKSFLWCCVIPLTRPTKNIICVYLLRLLKLVTALGSLWKHILHVFAAVGVVAIKEQSAVLKGVM